MFVLLLFSILFISVTNSYAFDEREGLEKLDTDILKQLITEIQDLKMDRDVARERIQELETDRDVDRKRVDTLERTVAAQNDRIISLLNMVDVKAVENKIESSKLNQTTIEMKHQYRKKKSIKQPPHTMIETKRIATGQHVAFSAYLKNNGDHLGANQNIVFDKILNNIGNAYNVHNGVFTAPVPGTYLITSTVMASWNLEVWCDIVVNGNAKAHTYARGTDGRHDQGSQTIVINLNQGDDVSVQNQAIDGAVWGAAYTTFSGFLLFEKPVYVTG